MIKQGNIFKTPERTPSAARTEQPGFIKFCRLCYTPIKTKLMTRLTFKHLNIPRSHNNRCHKKYIFCESAISPSDLTVNAAVAYLHLNTNKRLWHYRNFVKTKRQTGPSGMYMHCICQDNSKVKMYIALIFIHIDYYGQF